MRVNVLGVSAGLLVLAAATVSVALDVKLTVREPGGVNRSAEPVSGGIPLPGGQFKKDQAFAVVEGDKEIPAQVLPLVVDENGFLRWVLVDLQTDLKAGEAKTFTLKDSKLGAGRAGGAGASLKVTDGADSLTLDTGKVTLVISKNKPFALFDSVARAGKPVAGGGSVSYTDAFDAKKYVADKPRSVEVEYTGPMRATVCVKGRFVGDEQNNKLGYVARITVWAGKSEVLVKYSLCNSNPDHYCYRQVKDSSITLKLTGGAGAIAGASKPIEAAELAMLQSARVYDSGVHNDDSLGDTPWIHKTPGAKDPGGCVVTGPDGKELWASGGKADQSEGWVAAKSADGLLSVSDLYFVEDPPRAMAVTKDAIILSGVAEPAEGKSPFADRNRWLFDCSHLSSQYLFDFAAPADNAKLSESARRVRGRAWAMAEPGWYFSTEQLPVGKFGTQADELACYDAWGWKYDKKDIPTGPVDKMARVPRWTAGDDNHFTSEQDTLDVLVLMYLRTGQRPFFNAAETWANYFMDLQTWRTDGWQWKDGGGWWFKGEAKDDPGKGPMGNKPVRAKDPIIGEQGHLRGAYAKPPKAPFTKDSHIDLFFLANAKACHCHNWGEGLVEWFMLTGDRDAYESAIDTVEENYDTQIHAFGKAPGKDTLYSRDFTRACYLTNATRLIAPTDPFVVKASDELAAAFFGRPIKEPRGFVNGPHPGPLSKGELKKLVGQPGLDEMAKLGVTLDEKTGELTDPKSGAKWHPIVGVNTWMYPPLSRAMELYYRLTGNEDALDWVIAYGQAVAQVMYQPRHGCQHSSILMDFPARGVANDFASWMMPQTAKDFEGADVNGYLGSFYPDVAARAYSYCGEPLLKQRAYDYWFASSHRAGKGMVKVGQVGTWSNIYSTHKEQCAFLGRTLYEWSHPRADEQPPEAVADLAVTVKGDKATVTFTAPADKGGKAAGKVARYQVKAADRPIVAYEPFLKAFAAGEDAKCCNWWMASNLKGTPAPGKSGEKVSFDVTGVPPGAKYFAVVSFDDSQNRSPISNIAEAGK